MLNNELRPFLSHWHPVLGQWEKEHPQLPESEWPQSAECRAQLIVVQQRLQAYVSASEGSPPPERIGGFARHTRRTVRCDSVELTSQFFATQMEY